MNNAKPHSSGACESGEMLSQDTPQNTRSIPFGRGRCFDETKALCARCPRHILGVEATKRPSYWRERALAEIDPLHICAFEIRKAPHTPDEKRWLRIEADGIEREIRRAARGGAK